MPLCTADAEEQVAGLYRLVRRRLARWRTHPDWEDIVQEAAVRSWTAWQARSGPVRLSTFVYHAAERAAVDWLRSRRAYRRMGRVGHGGDPEIFSLEALSAAWRDRGNGKPAVLEPCWPDFAPRLIQALDERETWQRVCEALGALPEAEQELLRRTFFTADTLSVLAEEGGVSIAAIAQRRNRVLSKLGRALGSQRAETRRP